MCESNHIYICICKEGETFGSKHGPFLQLFKDLLNPSVEEEKQKHKRKRLVQSPNSYFMDVKCPGNSLFIL